MHFRKHFNQNGFSLPEVIISSFILILVVVGVMHQFSNSFQSLSISRKKADLSHLFQKLDGAAFSSAIIRSSVERSALQPTGNKLKNLALCAQRSGTVDCTIGTSSNFNNDLKKCLGYQASSATLPSICSHLDDFEFELFESGSGLRLAGPQSDPVRYRATGAPCDIGEAASPACPLEALAFFQPSCASCDQSTTLAVVTVIRRAPSVVSDKLPLATRLSSLAVIPVAQVQALNTSCASGAITGYDLNGAPICAVTTSGACSGPNQYMKRVNFKDNTVECGTFSFNVCGTRKYLQGINADGSPICADYTPNFTSCGSGEYQIGHHADGSAYCYNLKTWLQAQVTPLRRCVFYYNNPPSQPAQPGQPGQPATLAGCNACNACRNCLTCNQQTRQDIYISQNPSSCENTGDLDQGTLWYALPTTW